MMPHPGRKNENDRSKGPQFSDRRDRPTIAESSKRPKRTRGDWINQLATHLPDIVVFVDHMKELPFQTRFQGVLMFLDISGFTALCEKYSMNTKNGTDQLTKTLNGYMEALVKEILSADGDVLKFAGDAILTLWKVDHFRKMKSTIIHVIKSGLNIQKRYGEWTTAVGVKLRVKIGIAAGETNITFVGNDEFCHHVTLGRAVEAVNLAEKFCVSGDTVVSPTAWCHCSGIKSEHEVLSDGKHIKIISIESEELDESSMSYESVNVIPLSPSLANLVGGESHQAVLDKESGQKDGQRSDGALDKSHEADGATSSKRPSLKKDIHFEQREKTIRKSVIHEFTDFVELKKKLYVAEPVLRKIEDQQPLEYLSEMRQVTIVFINLMISECTTMELALTLQSSFSVIYTNVKNSQGCLNKIFMFDKGCTFLVIFGLPGFKHENDCAHALQCSNTMKKELDNVRCIECASIGVTTGSTFCGVVGHAHRHEYTVIGRKVNMAARLMMYYPNTVTCDNETFHHSKLHKGNFHHLELKEMKGLSNVGTIREFKPSSNLESQQDEADMEQEYEYPLVGRDEEIKLFIDSITNIKLHQGAKSQVQVIVFEGEPGIGKTKMLDSVIAKVVARKIKVISCALMMHDAKSPFYTMKSLLIDLLNFHLDMTHQDRENALLAMFTDEFMRTHICLLNDILRLKFPMPDSVMKAESKKREDLLREVIYRIVCEVNKKHGLIIFAIDDAHFVDAESWDLILVLTRDSKSLVLLTVRLPSSMCDTAEMVLAQPTTMKIPLYGLAPENLASLACQLLGVTKIPQPIDRLLRQKSHGVPSWCEQLLKEMLYGGMIRIETQSNAEEFTTMIAPPKHYLTRRRATVSDLIANEDPQGTSAITLKTFDDRGRDSSLICVVAPDKSLDIGLPNSIKGMIQARIDRMEELDQMVIKSASILGMMFSRVLLEEILPSNTRPRFGKSLQRLADSGIFICGSGLMNRLPGGSSMMLPRSKGTCECPLPDGTIAEKPMQECQYISFFSPSMQQTSYEMYLENMRRTLHIKAAKFLESQAHKCNACGGGNFLQDLLMKQQDYELNAREASNSIVPGSPMYSSARKTGRPATSESPDPQPSPSRASRTRAVVPVIVTEPSGGPERKHMATLDVDAVGHSKHPRRSSIAGAISRRISKTAGSFKRKGTHLERTSMVGGDTGRKSFCINTGSLLMTIDDQDVDDEEEESVPAEMDRRDCECLKILVSVYPMLVRHWRAAGNISKTVHYLMESGAAAIAMHDNMQALSYLKEASRIMQETEKGNSPFEEATGDLYVFNEYELSRAESLIGQSLFHMGRTSESIPYFYRSLRHLGCEQPSRRCQLNNSLIKNAFTQWKHCKFPNRYIGKANIMFTHRLNEQARSLSHILHWLLMTRQDKEALNTVLQQINKAEAADCDLHEVIMGYTCMMECCNVFQWRKLGEMYERKAIEKCTVALRQVTADDLVTITHFYMTSLNSRLAWGRIKLAIDSGYISHKLAEKIHDNDLRIQMLPVLSQALIMASRTIDSVDILKELHYIQEETKDHSAAIWYYACCMDIILETGFQLEKPDMCIKFESTLQSNPSFPINPLAQFYHRANLALWYLRKKEPEKVTASLAAVKRVMPENWDTFLSVRGLVKLTEIKLIQLSRNLTKKGMNKDQHSIVNLDEKIKQDFDSLKSLCEKMPVFEPRFQHLQAYQHAIWGRKGKAKRHIDKAVSLAKKIDNTLEAEWAEHNFQVWYEPDVDQSQVGVWQDNASMEMPDWHEANGDEVLMVKYSLPLPSWTS